MVYVSARGPTIKIYRNHPYGRFDIEIDGKPCVNNKRAKFLLLVIDECGLKEKSLAYNILLNGV